MLSLNILRQKHRSIKFSHPKPLPQNSESPTCFQTRKRPQNDLDLNACVNQT